MLYPVYVLYTADIQKLVQLGNFGVHLYTRTTGSFTVPARSSDAAELATRSMCVISAVKDWMSFEPV